jgi:hypothetical protein
MMTLNQAERMVRRIGEVVGHPTADSQAARLAQDYADLSRAANRRLEQCALMIEAGQGLQALQLAETPPPLLDLITILSFRQANEWRAYCQAHNLPWAEPFYDKYVRLLNSTYGKGITGDHPFYRDYRRAVLKNDDERAVSILRVIARLNPSDENTKEELKRIEEKMVRAKVETLIAALEKGDAAAAAEVAHIESSGLPVPSSHPVWQRVQVARCRELLGKADALRERGQWAEAEGLVEEIHGLATQNNLQLPGPDADLWSSLEEWTGSQRRSHVLEQDFKRAIAALEYEAQSLDNLRNSGTRMKAPAAQAAFEVLSARWREAEHFGREINGELADRCENATAWLQSQMRAAEKRQRALVAFFTLLILAAIGASVPLVLNWQSRRNYLSSLDALESRRRVADTQALVQQIPAKLKTNPKMAGGVAKADEFIAREAGLKDDFDRKVAALKQTHDAGGSIEQTSAQRAACEKVIALLAPEFQPAAKATIASLDLKWASARDAELTSRLDRAGQIALGLSASAGVGALSVTVSRLEAALAGTDALLAQPPAVATSLEVKYRELTAKAEQWKGTMDDWERTDAELRAAPGMDEYLQALAHLAKSPLATGAQQEAAAGIARLGINGPMLLGELLLPNDKDAWGLLTNAAALPATFMPSEPSAQEKEACLRLRDDKNMQDVYAYELKANPRAGNPLRTHPVFSQGLITRDRAGDESGLIYDPAEHHGPIRFEQQSYDDWDYISATKLFRTQECDSYERLGLGEVIDSNTGKYQKSILQLFDQLNQDENSSAVFRAFVTMELYDLAEMRPLDWGFQWAPDVAQHIQKLRDLGAGQLQSGDWMVRAQVAKYEKPLQKYFETARTVSLEKEAEFTRELAVQTCNQGFEFSGFVGADGRPFLREAAAAGAEYWGWDARTSSAGLLFRRGANGLEKLGEPMPSTPLLAFPGDRRKILLDAQQAMSQSAAATEATLPPFFSGL